MVEVFHTINEWTDKRNAIRGERTIGFVPTMGALHTGHRSLMERSVKENDITVVSIFVNPTQFDDPNDLRNYPSTMDDDIAMLNKVGVDYLINPEYDALYPDDYKYKVHENDLSTILEGAHRKGHFDGVLTVVLKLLCIAKADKAYFGEKDYQQYKLIEGMAKAFFLDTEIVPCPTIREDDGLALSSRNVRLTEEERKLAPEFNKALRMDAPAEEAVKALKEKGFKVDYIEDVGTRRYGAVFLGKVRLIDNIELKGDSE